MDTPVIQRDNNGRFTARPSNGAPPITSENARLMIARRKFVGLRAKLRGMAKGAGIEPPTDAEIEALIELGGDALELYTAHLGTVFMKSNSLRGMSDPYHALAETLTGDRRQRDEDTDTPHDQPTFFVLIQQYIMQYKSTDTRNDDEVIDAE